MPGAENIKEFGMQKQVSVSVHISQVQSGFWVFLTAGLLHLVLRLLWSGGHAYKTTNYLAYISGQFLINVR